VGLPVVLDRLQEVLVLEEISKQQGELPGLLPVPVVGVLAVSWVTGDRAERLLDRAEDR
jgi:hypothetical protein